MNNDIIGILDSNFEKIASYEYDSYGKLLGIYDNLGNNISNNQNHIAYINPFRYRSYYYDSETELYYLNHRYYNPNWCRFINTDPILNYNGEIKNLNLFSYCQNDPINNIDISGECGLILPWTFGILLKVAMVCVAAYAVTETVAIAAPTVIESVNELIDSISKADEADIPIELPKKPQKKHKLYVLYHCTVDNGIKVEYVGRTSNVNARKAAHGRGPRKDLIFQEFPQELTYAQARIGEEMLIRYYKTLNKDKGSLKYNWNNKIHGLRLTDND